MGNLIQRHEAPVPSTRQPAVSDIWIDDYLDDRQRDVARHGRILFKHKRVLLAVALAVFVIGTIYTMWLPRIYSSRVNLQIEPEQNLLGYKEAHAVATPDVTYLRTQAQVLKSEVLAVRVVQRLQLVKDPARTTSVTGWFRSRVVVQPVEGTQILSVSFRSEDPAFAAQAINTLADEYVNYGFDSRRETTTRARNYVEAELEKAEARLHGSEQRLVDYGRAHNILLPTADNNVINQKLVDLNTELTKVDTEILANQYRALGSTTVENFPESLKSPVMIALDARRSDLEQKLARANLLYGPKWPELDTTTKELDEVRKQLAAEKQRILGQAGTSYQIASVHRSRLMRAIADQNRLADQLTQDSIQYNLLKREVETDRQMHEGLLQRLKEMEASVGLKALNIHVIDRGEVPTLPTLPNVPLNLAFALTLGLMCGAGAAYGREFFDRSVKTPEDVGRQLQVPFLGAVPTFQREWQEATGGHLLPVDSLERLLSSESAAVYWESYRGVRTSILFSSPQHRPQTLLVTSALPGEGKSTTAINLAISLAQTGARTLLIELDMRKPKFADMFNVSRKSGMSRYLSGNSRLSAEMCPTLVPNLCLVPAGPVPPNPPELIGSQRMRSGLELVRRHFEFVVIDGPPVLAVSDAAIIATQVDGVVLVVSSKTPSGTAVKARNVLNGVSARILGAVINNVKLDASEHYFYSTEYVSSEVVPRFGSGGHAS